MPDPRTPRLGGHVLVEALIEQGIETCFGVPGESYLPVLDGFFEHGERIRFIACRNEGGAAFMAEAGAKLSGRPGICFVTRGPGATNASIGLHTAFQDSTPLILFIGQVGTEVRDREAFQELDYRAVFGPNSGGFAKWVAEVPSAGRLPEYVARAFHIAQQGRPGPVVLALPEEVLTAVTAAPVLPRVEPAQAWPAPGALRDLRAMLLAAERPLVIAGGSGWTPEATRALERFAEGWQLPVGCAFRRQDLFDPEHPLCAGHVGIGIDPKLAKRVREADLIIALGARLDEMTTGTYTLIESPRPRQKLIHIHAGAEELGRVFAADLLLQSSMGHAAKALETLAAPPQIGWLAWARATNADHRANLEGGEPVAPIDLAEVVRAVHALAPDAVICNGAGNFSGWVHRFHLYPVLHRHGRSQLAPTSGAMGYGLPAAVAASLLQPGRPAICFAGDGDFLMNGQELATATAHGGRPIVVVVDNGSYGTIRMHQEREFPQRVSGTALANPDFAALARAYGWVGERIEQTAAFAPALAAALARREPTLLHLPVDPELSTSRQSLSQIRAAALRARGDAGTLGPSS
ncbi:thiamine pyrophosphate-binding protein [Rivibacter subsaxonicus]|uniref:Acetolactate synthase-1/2/3 large subunit n=1 Tax=Rivibacter subsaxonicus TaxID=457575 RepID=A0A4Q7VPQ7_9BURK|nr:thiamine pyrophosphate-binding protein [Rivibacter subsaxonicus]RZT98177.1 acetolactate synthase-1/2/3 large subunit [Rivibacter subsaxonicus]